jgi:hypothetical protein
MPDPGGFADCYLKIERAKQHVRDLHARMSKLTADDSYVITVEADANGGDDSIKLAAVEVVPGELLCIIGDAIHNLRTALDFAMNHMVRNPTKFTKFPVRDSRKELVDAINGGLKTYASEDIVKFIVDFVQPYPNGRGAVIWAIHGLDIEDKHGTLIAHNELEFVSGMRGVDQRGTEFEIDTWLIVSNRVATEKLRSHRNVEITDKGRPTLRIVFGQGMPMEGSEVLPTLTQFVNFVAQTVENIEISYPVFPYVSH